MKKLIFLLSTIFLLLQACSSGNNDNANNGNSIILCKHKVFSNGSAFDYLYDGNKILMVSCGGEVVLKYYYTGDLITKVETFDTNQLATRTTYNYNSANQLINENSVNYLPDPNNPEGSKTDYSYNSNNTISFINYFGLSGTQYTINSSGTIILNNGEITTVNENFQSNVPNTSTMTRTYDNKNSPFKNILGINKILTRDGAGGSFQSKLNNPITIGFTNNIISYSYQYNEQGYPVSEHITNSNSSSTSSCQYYY
jgi:YD repeat-containing protein